jgi:hypothetical protein
MCSHLQIVVKHHCSVTEMDKTGKLKSKQEATALSVFEGCRSPMVKVQTE